MSKSAISHGIAAIIGASLFAVISSLLMPTHNGDTPVSSTVEERQGLPEQQQNNVNAAELNQMSNENSSLLINKNKEIALLKNRITEQNQQLAQFKKSLEQQGDSDKVTELATKPALKNMTFSDFEDSMKQSFTDRFKNVVLQMSEELENVKTSFEQSTDTNEWSSNYESLISSYLAEHNSNGDHFVESLSCNTRVCRLEVNTTDEGSWDSLYAGLTSQSWFESLTVQEQSDYQGNVIYYLPSLKN